MKEDYISRRKLVKTLKYITNRKLNVTLIDDHDCSFSGARYYNKYTGIIKTFSVIQYEDSEIKLNVEFTNGESAQIWLSNMYYLCSFDLHKKIRYDDDNGDGTYSHFEIIINDNPMKEPDVEP